MIDEKDLELLRKEIGKGLSDDEWSLFLATCKAKKLDPFTRQVLPIKTYNKKKQCHVVQHLTTIDGYRLIAVRSGEYQGQTGPFWCGDDGVWQDVWLKNTPPVACKIGVMRRDFREPLHAVARFSSYAKTYNNKPTGLWASMSDLMLAKVCEALALRKAFPNELSGLYTREEMDQADNPERPAVAMQEAVARVKDELGGDVVPDDYKSLPIGMAGRDKMIEFARRQLLDETDLIREAKMAKARLGYDSKKHKWSGEWAAKVLENMDGLFKKQLEKEISTLMEGE